MTLLKKYFNKFHKLMKSGRINKVVKHFGMTKGSRPST